MTSKRQPQKVEVATKEHGGKPRIGVIGYGFIGRSLVDRIIVPESGLELAFVHNRTAEHLSHLPDAARLDDLANAAAYDADIIVETAHPAITEQHGVRFLGHSSYMPLSTTALVDDALRNNLIEAAQSSGHQLYLAAGALIGGSALMMRPDQWERVRITFRKHPDNIDFSDSAGNQLSATEPTTIYDGPVRGLAKRFPRNVNTMVTCALLSTGLDACEGALIADPSLDCAVAEVEAWGIDGGSIRTEKRQPAIGVSGTEMLDSVWQSVRRAVRATGDPFQFV